MRGKSLYRYIGENGRGYYDEDGTRHQFVRGNCYWLSPSSPILNSSWFAVECIQPPTVTCNSASDLQHDCEQLAAWLDSLPEKMKWRKHTWPLLKESVQNLVRAAVRFGMSEPPNTDGHDELSVRGSLNKVREWAGTCQEPTCAEPPTQKSAERPTWSIDEVLKALETLVDEGERYSSMRGLAQRLSEKTGRGEPSTSTITKAIKASPKLQTWEAQTKRRRSPRAQALDSPVLDGARQSTELSPEDDAAIREYIENADNETKAAFLGLPLDVQIMIVNDPDKYDKLLSRKP